MSRVIQTNVAETMCTDGLRWARNRDYAGWDPYDALNSPFFPSARMHWVLRLVAIHGVNKAPINLRQALRVPEERNPKGIALFAMAYLNRYEATGTGEYLDEAERLLRWLERNSSARFELPCWGYNFDWQNGRKFFLAAHHPSIVVSVFCARAFVRHHAIIGDERSLAIAKMTCEFIRTEINTREVNGHRAYTYTPYDSFVVINANALAARLFAQVGTTTDDFELVERARELVSFVLAMQSGDGAWYYAAPADDSHLSHDNFHTGFVLESLHRCLQTGIGDGRLEPAYRRGLDFYRERLFEPNGAPKFEHDQSYPYDVHAAAQAVVTCVEDGTETSVALAEAVIDWTRNWLYDEEGYFYRRIGRFTDDRTPYMRWNQAWMTYALSRYLAGSR